MAQNQRPVPPLTLLKTAGGTAKVPGIAGHSVDVVVTLPIEQLERHICFAEDDGAGALCPPDKDSVLFRHEVLELRDTPRRRQSSDIVGFLDRYRHTEQGS